MFILPHCLALLQQLVEPVLLFIDDLLAMASSGPDPEVAVARSVRSAIGRFNND